VKVKPGAAFEGFTIRHLLDIKSLSVSDVKKIFALTDSFHEILQRPIKVVPALKGKTIALLFFEPSTRTRLSFELAIRRLSGEPLILESHWSSAQKGEKDLETVRNILALQVDGFVIRHRMNGFPHYIAKHISVPVINAGDGTHEHPTQALLDAYTLTKLWGSLEGKRILIVGDVLHSRVARSDLLLFNMLGAEVGFCGPKVLLPPYPSPFCQIFSSLEKGLAWADSVIVLRIQLERQSQRFYSSSSAYYREYGVTLDRVLAVNPDVLVLHPGPSHLGVDLDPRLLQDERCLMYKQVSWGHALRMGLLYYLFASQNEVEKR
jgi:aspartate carbamoyltransferase catalytic subunit